MTRPIAQSTCARAWLTGLLLVGLTGCGKMIVDDMGTAANLPHAGGDAGAPTSPFGPVKLPTTCRELKVTPSRTRSLALGTDRTCAIMDDCTVQCWGNPVARDGGGFVAGSVVPTRREGLENVLEMELSEDAACALLRDGTVTCLGDNNYGQLGDSTHDGRSSPAPVPSVTDVTRILSTGVGVMARSSDGTVSFWGWTTAGGVRRPSALPDVAGVAELGNNTRIIANDGTIWIVGYDLSVSRFWPDVPGRVVAYEAPCGLLDDGSVWCDPPVTTGGDAQPTPTPTRVESLSGVHQLAGDRRSACALAGDQVYCWGANDHGQLGDGTQDDRDAPVPVLSDVVEIAGSAHESSAHFCARRTDRSVWCWGQNGRSQVGDGTTVDRSTPVRVL